MTGLSLPISNMELRELSVGEQIAVSGVIFTFREGAHRHLHEGGELPFDPSGSFIYHCGPTGRRQGKKFTLSSAGPDLSTGLDIYPADIFGRFGIRGIIGRGGMGPRAQAACKRYSACYFHTIGGAGLALARYVTQVRDVHLRDKFDLSDAIWELEVENFPAIVTIDAFGRNLHDIVRDVSSRRFINLSD